MKKFFGAVLIGFASLVVSLMIFEAKTCFADDNLKADLEQVFADFLSIRREVFGNSQFSVRSQIRSGEKSVTLRKRYWSRENKYFRVDVFDESAGPSSKVVERLLIRPEGLVRMEDAGSGLAVLELTEDLSSKHSLLYGHPFYACSTRGREIGAECWFSNFLNLEGYEGAAAAPDAEVEVEKILVAGADFAIRETKTLPNSVSQAELSFMSDRRHALKRFDYGYTIDKTLKFDMKKEFEYSQDTNSSVPTKVKVTTVRLNAPETKTNMEIFDVDLTPAPLSVVSLEAVGLEGLEGILLKPQVAGNWTRRMLFLVGGLLFVGAILVYRQSIRGA